MISVAAGRYADALVEVVFAPHSGLDPREVREQLRTVEGLMAASADLRHVMLSPAVTASKKRRVIERLSAGLGLAPKVRNFLYVVIDHRRMDQLAGIREAYEAAIDERMGVVRADVVSARSLDDAQRASLEAELSKITRKRVRMEFSVDESLIGGVLARIGSTVYDGSVRGQLNAMRRRLSAEA
jgi:F-type H+-transporting ATPase subunit delta